MQGKNNKNKISSQPWPSSCDFRHQEQYRILQFAWGRKIRGSDLIFISALGCLVGVY